MIKCSEALGKIIERRERYFTPDEMETVNVAHGKLIVLEEAEEQGRLVILPCKVGDTVWWIPPTSFTWLDLRPYCCMIVSVAITENKKRERRKKYRIAELRDGFTIDNVHDIDFEDFGKTVFLSRAEAEAALKGETEDV